LGVKSAPATFVLLAFAASVGSPHAKDDPAPTKEVGLVERAERRLIPLTVRIRALTPQSRSRAAHLTKADFSVILDLAELPPDRFELDNFCPDVGAERPPEQPESSKHLLFFVNQMDTEGLENTHAMLQNMIPRMAAEGYRLKLLPGAASDWTADADRLLRDVERLFDPPTPPREPIEESSESRVRALLESNRVDEALAEAQEEELSAQLTLEGPSLQLERTIAEMADLPIPKALIYFADSRYSSRERIVEAAIRSGVAIYAIKADGIAPYDPNFKVADDPGAITTSSLLSLSEHTGGRVGYGHFRKSASDKILQGVQADLSCVYMLSLDVAGLDQNRRLRPKIALRSAFKDQLRAESIPEVMIQSDERQHVHAAAIALRTGRWPGVRPAGVALVPIGFDKARVDVLMQMNLRTEPGAPSIATTWDVGLNYFGASRVSGYGNVRVTSRSPQIVFQKQVRLSPGPYWVVGIAQEVDGRGSARGTEVGVLAEPKKKAVEFVHSLDIMQWEAATFVSEEGTARPGGWSPLRYGMANSDRPLSLVFSLCRGRNAREPLKIEKSLLLPDTEIRFSSTAWPREPRNPCLVVNDDPLAAGRLPWSQQPYEATFVVKAVDAAGRTVARTAKAFWVIGPTREAAAPR
jgi:hypothetical protein